MAYTKQTWTDGVSQANATRLGYMETGIETAQATADTNASNLTAHAAAADPHPGYLTPAEGNAAYPAETATTVGTLISGATAKTTPIDADTVGLSDSAASNVLKKVTWANVKATLKAYLDTLYATISHAHAGTDITSGTINLARLPDSIPTDEKQSSGGVWPSTAASATRRVVWIGYPGNSTPPATTGRPAFVVNVDSYVLRA
jgi:hypothetical protein